MGDDATKLVKGRDSLLGQGNHKMFLWLNCRDVDVIETHIYGNVKKVRCGRCISDELVALDAADE